MNDFYYRIRTKKDSDPTGKFGGPKGWCHFGAVDHLSDNHGHKVVEFDRKTTCMATGWKDRYGTAIYENDIIEMRTPGGENIRRLVVWSDDNLAFMYSSGPEAEDLEFLSELSPQNINVVGDIFNDPELLEGQA